MLLRLIVVAIHLYVFPFIQCAACQSRHCAFARAFDVSVALYVLLPGSSILACVSSLCDLKFSLHSVRFGHESRVLGSRVGRDPTAAAPARTYVGIRIPSQLRNGYRKPKSAGLHGLGIPMRQGAGIVPGRPLASETSLLALNIKFREMSAARVPHRIGTTTDMAK